MQHERKEPILDKLAGERVFTAFPLANGMFRFRENCDDYFSVDLTKDEVMALAQELMSMAITGVDL